MNSYKEKRCFQVGVVVGLVCVVAVTGCGKSKAKREYEQTMMEVNEDGAAERMRTQKEAKEQTHNQEEMATQEKARLAPNKKQQENEDREERMEADREQREAAKEKQKEERENAQMERDIAAYAAVQFDKVCLEPKVLMSPRVKALNLNVSFVGKDLPAYKKCLAEKDWPGILKLLGLSVGSQYASKEQVDSVIYELKKHQFQLLVKAPIESLPKGKLCYIPIWSIDDPDTEWFGFRRADAEVHWEVHPDNVGWLHAWSPAATEILLLLSESTDRTAKGNVSQQREEIDHQISKTLEGLERKRELGELDDAGMTMQVRALKNKKREAYLGLLNRF